ncbi:MAG: preprotein translocase subunit SecG [Candidatus Pacebacteria bacterium]|nr:preprotein translocase subunit SecG [Candidatus Paceibacterota bacterium]
MNLLAKFLPYVQIIVSVILVTAILLQQSAAGMGGALGGDDSSAFHHTRRGFEKFLFYLSIVCAFLFAFLALLSIIIKAQI